jgi:H2-forming N5,N10-methylenetetrahydromethanopterin dehydrogenase-like enzyme
MELSRSATAKSEASAALSTIPVQVFLQIASESQRERAKEVAAALQQRRYVTPGIENVSGIADIPKKQMFVTSTMTTNQSPRA